MSERLSRNAERTRRLPTTIAALLAGSLALSGCQSTANSSGSSGGSVGGSASQEGPVREVKNGVPTIYLDCDSPKPGHKKVTIESTPGQWGGANFQFPKLEPVLLSYAFSVAIGPDGTTQDGKYKPSNVIVVENNADGLDPKKHEYGRQETIVKTLPYTLPISEHDPDGPHNRLAIIDAVPGQPYEATITCAYNPDYDSDATNIYSPPIFTAELK